MDCEFTEKVSLLLDKELTAAESLRVKDHIAGCKACQQAQEDFSRLRREIKAYDFQPQTFAQAGMLARILKQEKLPLWRRSVSLPLPLMTCLLAIVVALGLWTAALRRASSIEQSKRSAPENAATPAKAPPSQAEAFEGRGVDFSHYDHGERAAIYKVRSTASSTAVAAPDARQ
jgi:anti-sigma factor RsiW